MKITQNGKGRTITVVWYDCLDCRNEYVVVDEEVVKCPYCNSISAKPKPTDHGVMRAKIGAILTRLVPFDALACPDLARLKRFQTACREIGALVDSHEPNPDDETACPHCGIADGCDHVDGCPYEGVKVPSG